MGAGTSQDALGQDHAANLRKIAAKEHDQLGDISTLADPSVVEQLIGERPRR